MRKILWAFVALCFVFVCVSDAHAWIFGKKKEADKEGTAAVGQAPGQKPADVKAQQKVDAQKAKADKALEEALRTRKAAQDKRRAELNNTEWQIDLSPMGGKGKKESETVIFKDNQISFLNYAKKGFPATNYSLTVQDDGSVIWETMQTSEKNGIAFWRGEMDPRLQEIRGVMSHQIDPKTKQDYSIVSISRRTVEQTGK